mmetsp:Transcript_30343/g.76471  ORF Transcript_30343/g.76471 Transcript_30343/m.76471 type:complete len:398 (+) Transcript_30343:1320-2513(+)
MILLRGKRKVVEGGVIVDCDPIAGEMEVAQAVLRAGVVPRGAHGEPFDSHVHVLLHSLPIGVHVAQLAHGLGVVLLCGARKVVQRLGVVALESLGAVVVQLPHRRLRRHIAQVRAVLVVLQHVLLAAAVHAARGLEAQPQLVHRGEAALARLRHHRLRHRVVVQHRSRAALGHAQPRAVPVAQHRGGRCAVAERGEVEVQEAARRVVFAQLHHAQGAARVVHPNEQPESHLRLRVRPPPLRRLRQQAIRQPPVPTPALLVEEGQIVQCAGVRGVAHAEGGARGVDGYIGRLGEQLLQIRGRRPHSGAAESPGLLVQLCGARLAARFRLRADQPPPLQQQQEEEERHKERRGAGSRCPAEKRPNRHGRCRWHRQAPRSLAGRKDKSDCNYIGARSPWH